MEKRLEETSGSGMIGRGSTWHRIEHCFIVSGGCRVETLFHSHLLTLNEGVDCAFSVPYSNKHRARSGKVWGRRVFYFLRLFTFWVVISPVREMTGFVESVLYRCDDVCLSVE